jgi:O-phospho-L-seryl-tRNASec:L-selenocysteinyl-tRNA synthase
MAEQPKAAGSSLIVQLTRYLTLDAIHLAGIKAAKACCVLPAATGLTMTLVFLALKQLRPAGRYVVWSRIDQKSCFKGIGAAGLKPIVIELRRAEGSDALCTDVEAIRAAVEKLPREEVLCICTTTSTFAPRVPDAIDEVAVLAKELDVPHVINNAYGLQCSKCTHLIETGCRRGRVDAFVQSTDKNFLVPVGGAIVASPQTQLVEKVAGLYPGRASMSPLLDLFITLLHLGVSGWKALLKERKDNMAWFQERFAAAAQKHNLRLLSCPANRISLCCDLNPLIRNRNGAGVANGSTTEKDKEAVAGEMDHLTFLGSALFTRRVSGPRVVLCTPFPEAPAVSSAASPDEAQPAVSGRYKKVIDGVSFESYGAHADTYPYCYMTAACAIGATRQEMESFLQRFDSAIQDYKGRSSNKK